MYARAETILFSTLVVLLAVVTLAGATALVFPQAMAAGAGQQARAPGAAGCTVAAAPLRPAG